jgi:hypothetical protein
MANMQGNKKQDESPLSFQAESLLQLDCDLAFDSNIVHQIHDLDDCEIHNSDR